MGLSPSPPAQVCEPGAGNVTAAVSTRRRPDGGDPVPERNFRQLLEGRWRDNRLVCVGLDPDWEKIPSSLKIAGGQEREPGDVLADFNRAIIDATRDIAG